MTESKAYIEVAERSLEAAAGALDRNIHEKAGFLTYHAFESTGGAYCRSRGVPYPMGHVAKLNTFKSSARREKYGRSAAELAIVFGSLRNLTLYPHALQNGEIRLPRNTITPAQVTRLMGRTRTLVSRVKPDV